MIKLSIIIPVYNVEKFLDDCLKSIFSELCVNDCIEVIVINDGSTDKSLEICKKYEQLIIINKQNGGVSSARNLGIEKSSGEYVMFVDADDSLSKGWKGKVLFHLNANESDIYMFSKTYRDDNQVNKKELFISLIMNNNNNYQYISTPWSKIYKKELLLKNKIKFISEIINGEDQIFNANCIVKSERISMCSDNFYNYRITRSSSTKKFNYKIFESDKIFHKELSIILSSNLLDLNLNEVQMINNFVVKNNIYVLSLRMTYSGKYSIFKNNTFYFKEYFKKLTSDCNLGFFKNFIVYLLKKNFNFLVYIILRLKNTYMCFKKEQMISI